MVKAKSAFFYSHKSTEYLGSEAFPRFLLSAGDSTIADMNNITTQPPKHFNRAGIEDCLRRILGNQEAMAHTFWEAFQSLGYRLDKHDIDFETVRDRLWRIEHPA